MEVTRIETAPGACRLALQGEMNIYTAVQIRDALAEAVRAHGRVELDLGAVGEMDSAGFQQIFQAHRACTGAGGEFRIVAMSDAVREVLELYRHADRLGGGA
ncbi:MAG: STAS domain-containing protein [Gammaproteobacteria bacterium]